VDKQGLLQFIQEVQAQLNDYLNDCRQQDNCDCEALQDVYDQWLLPIYGGQAPSRESVSSAQDSAGRSVREAPANTSLENIKVVIEATQQDMNSRTGCEVVFSRLNRVVRLPGQTLTFQEEQLRLGFPFQPPKPRKVGRGKLSTLDNFYDLVGKNPDGHLNVKYDGVRVIIHIWNGGRGFAAFSEGGQPAVDQIPLYEDIFRSLPVENAIFDCEVEMWQEGERKPRENASGVLQDKEFIDDDLIFNIFDILALDGRWLRIGINALDEKMPHWQMT